MTAGYPLTRFDRLAIFLSCFGAAVMLALHVLIVPSAAGLYSPLEGVVPGLSRLVYSRGYAVASVLLMLFLAYYGSRMRRIYDSVQASNVLFVSLLVAIAANGLLVYGLYAPAREAMDFIGS